MRQFFLFVGLFLTLCHWESFCEDSSESSIALPAIYCVGGADVTVINPSGAASTILKTFKLEDFNLGAIASVVSLNLPPSNNWIPYFCANIGEDKIAVYDASKAQLLNIINLASGK